MLRKGAREVHVAASIATTSKTRGGHAVNFFVARIRRTLSVLHLRQLR
jgi:hypothetical protein